MRCNPRWDEVRFPRFACVAAALLLGVFALPSSFLGHAAGQYTPPLTVQFSAAYYLTNESAGAATITATLNRASTQVVTVRYATQDGTATAPTYYRSAAGVLSFASGQTSQTVQVTVVHDNLPGPNKTVNLALSSPTNANIGTPGTAVLTIVDDDPPYPTVAFGTTDYRIGEYGRTATIVVALSGVASVPVTVSYATSDGTAVAPTDYLRSVGTLTFAPGETSQTFQVPVVADGIVGPNKTVNLTLSNASGVPQGAPSTAVLTIFDQDSTTPPTVQLDSAAFSGKEHDGPITVSVTLNEFWSQPVTVNYSTSDGTAVAQSDYVAAMGTVTFNPGDSIQTFQVALLPNTNAGANKTFNVTLSTPVGASLGAPSAAVVTIVNDNMPAPTVQFDQSSYTYYESVGTAVTTVTLSNYTYQNVTVSYTTGDDSATAPEDYVSATGTLTFAPGQTSKDIPITIKDDGDAATRKFTIILSGASSATLGAQSTTQVVLLGDPTPAPAPAGLTVELKINGTKDTDANSDDDYVLVPPAGATFKPYATLTITLSGAAGTIATVYLSQGGSGAVTFENDAPDVTVGTPLDIKIFGKTASAKKDDTLINASLTKGGAAAATENMTVVDGVQIAIKGCFQDRLATDNDPSAEKRGAKGWTFALEGEPDLDRIIRFSSPASLRSRLFKTFMPVQVTQVVALKPANVTFANGDALIGQAVNLGSKSLFAGEKDGPGLEPIQDFEFNIGPAASLMFSGECTTVPKGQNIKVMTNAQKKDYGIDIEADWKAKVDGVTADYNALSPADQAGTVNGRNLKRRMGWLTNMGPGTILPIIKEVRTYYVDYPGTVDKNIKMAPGSSQVLKIWKDNKAFSVAMRFYGWDADGLVGEVTGTLQLAP